MPVPEMTTEVHYGVVKTCNPTVEKLRHAESLCYNCERFKPGKDHNCPAANDFFQAGQKWQISVIITQCPTDMFIPAEENYYILQEQSGDPFGLDTP